MDGPQLLILVTLVLIVAGAVELWAHRRRLRRIPIRIHVNGTRGKSSVTRLIAAALREAGIVTCAKTTGTLARMILPDGREVPIFRPAGANVLEQLRIVSTAHAYGAQALVIECMALAPELQSLSERRMVEATHGVITNARPDHLDVMGPDPKNVARALAGSTPVRAKLYTAEREHLEVLRNSAEDRGSELVAVGEEDVRDIGSEVLDHFRYTEHADNVALALRVCVDLGVEREVALQGMWKSPPDPGAMTEHAVSFFGREIMFVNAFAANDPVSSRLLWELALARHPECEQKIMLFNCRADRVDRSMHLGEEFSRWPQVEKVVLMGSGTYLFARAAALAGYEAERLVFAEGLDAQGIFEQLVSLVEHSALIVGMGNIGGAGLDLVQYFRNRSAPKREASHA